MQPGYAVDVLFICLLVSAFITQDFEEACFLLKKCGAVHVSQQEVTASAAGLEVLSFLQGLLQPFIDSYQVLLTFASSDCDNARHA